MNCSRREGYEAVRISGEKHPGSNHRQHTPRGGRSGFPAFGFAFLAGVIANAHEASAAEPTAVPAEFVREILPPGISNGFVRPSGVAVDPVRGEVLVADPGNNRIVIFDEHGTYRYEFAGGDRFAVPLDVAVDSRGLIYVLGSTSRGRGVFRFDFDGLYLSQLTFEAPVGGEPADPASFAVDDHDRLYVLDAAGLRILRYDADGSLAGAFAVAADLDEGTREEVHLGSIAIAGGEIFIPDASVGTVYVHSLDGARVRSIGHKGNEVGQLSFPVDVAVSGDVVLVLDKHRFNVVCFGLDGEFRGEFGGKGTSPGWFYHPTILAADGAGQVYIGQVFQSKVQLCRIPPFIANGDLLGGLY
jgi:DNA-binding beta-propeller fold protein YncE